MKGSRIIDIILCAIVLPGMILFFPVTEWATWHSGYFALYVIWLYSVYFAGRKLLGPQLLRGRRGTLTVTGAVLLIVTVTFLMSLAPVDFPREEGAALQPYVRAMWLLLFAVLGMSIPLGMAEAQVIFLASHLSRESAIDDERAAIQRRGADAVGDGEVLLKSGYKTVHVPLSSIQFIESRNNYACFHLDNQDDVITQISLKEVMNLLPEGKFMRIHRSYVVPVWRIEKRSMTDVSIMGVDAQLPVGRAFKDALKNG